MPMATRSPLLHAVAVDERGAEGVDLGHHLGEGPALVLVDEEGLVALQAGPANRSRSVGGTFSKIVCSTPPIAVVAVWNAAPGLVSSATASS